jgi:hypothetical protein
LRRVVPIVLAVLVIVPSIARATTRYQCGAELRDRCCCAQSKDPPPGPLVRKGCCCQIVRLATAAGPDRETIALVAPAVVPAMVSPLPVLVTPTRAHAHAPPRAGAGPPRAPSVVRLL